jgi:hypothetical protein
MDTASEPDPAAGGRFTGSADIAYSWVQRMAGGDFQGAYDLCDPALQSGADSAAAADGSAPADALAAYFYTHTLGGDFFTDATFQGVEHDDGNGLDVATFTLQMSSGDPVTLLVYVDGDLQVTDFL